MARTTTPNGSLGMWADGENPGAGTQDAGAIGTGLNDNWKILDKLFVAHDTNGAHRSGVIDAATTVDGSTLEQDGATKKLKVKAGGVGTTQLATDAVDATILKDDGAVDANRAVTTNHIRDSAVTTAKIADDAVTAPKISHDNKRTKILLAFDIGGSGAGRVGGTETDPAYGIPLTRAGSVTAIGTMLTDGGGGIGGGGGCFVTTFSYGTYTFAAGSFMNVISGAGATTVQITGVSLCNDSWYPFDNPVFVTVELEFDD